MTTKTVVSDLKKIIQIQEKIIKRQEIEVKALLNVIKRAQTRSEDYCQWLIWYRREAETLTRIIESFISSEKIDADYKASIEDLKQELAWAEHPDNPKFDMEDKNES